MDGRFAPNISVGPAIVNAVRPSTAKPLNVYLMIVDLSNKHGDRLAILDAIDLSTRGVLAKRRSRRHGDDRSTLPRARPVQVRIRLRAVDPLAPPAREHATALSSLAQEYKGRRSERADRTVSAPVSPQVLAPPLATRHSQHSLRNERAISLERPGGAHDLG